MSTLRPWSPTGPLVRGITLIEASAGTGKTYNITSLVVRLVAEAGVPIDRICIVTYTRAATAELKDRVRGRLVQAAEVLAGAEPPEDPVYAQLWSEDAAIRSRRSRRLRDAVEAFDQALISTIHGFCQRMLQINAFESGAAFDLDLAPDTDDLLGELVDDHLSKTLYDATPDEVTFLRGTCGLRREPLLKLAKAALADPDTPVVPAPDSARTSDWPARVGALAAEWEALAEAFAQYVDAQVQAAKAGQPSPLKKGQRKHKGATVRAWAEGVAAWLAADPPLGSEPPEADRYDAKKIKGQLVDPAVGLSHPCLEQLDALRAFPGEVAGAVRSAFVAEIRERFAERMARRRLQTYADLLRGLARRLGPEADEEGRRALAGAIGRTFDAALIDEFQDTDHHQWTIFHTAFGQGGHHLYLIGDPKQAIYGFRGANIHVYAKATLQAGDRRFTMTTNWRSDARLLAALNHLLDRPHAFGPSAPFGYIPVQAPPHRSEDGLQPEGGWEAPQAAPVQLRWFDGELVGGEAGEPAAKGALHGVLEARVAEDVVALLSSETQIRDGERLRRVRPGDVAVLVRKGRQAAALQEALTAVGVPAVLTGAASVLASDEAREVEHWLAALVEPAGGSAARLAASTRMFGWSADDLLAVEDEDPEAVARWDRWMEALVAWRDRWVRHGFMRAFRQALDEAGVVVRLLGLEGGERRVTNLLHVAELLHDAETRQRLRPDALRAWLAQRRAEDDLDADEVELRLDSDDEAVRLLTMHKAKGLEFPVCFVPYLWDGGMVGSKPDQPLVVPDPQAPDRRLLDVGLPVQPAHQVIAEREAREEGLRLAYVALTRARHRVVVYGGLAKDYETSPLAAILHGQGADRMRSAQGRVAEGPQALAADLAALQEGAEVQGGPAIAVLPCDPPDGRAWSGGQAPPPEVGVRRFSRGLLDFGWRRHSYSSVARAAGHPELVEEGREGFDPDAVDEAGPLPPAPLPDEVPLAAFPGGAAAGTLLHEVLEHVDFGGPTEALEAEARRRLTVYGFDAERFAPVLTRGLSLSLTTPLGAALGDRSLAGVGRPDRLDELRFDLPILGGSAHRGQVDPRRTARALVQVLRSRDDGVLPSDWLGTLDRLWQVGLAGFLTGSIDLIFRTDGRWYVADYKSNRLDPRRTGRCVPDAFDRRGMTQEMARHDYFLQYHLYLVALHRFLRWRLPDYDYDRHVGGVYYLFLRGMVGPETATDGEAVNGCWFDRPPQEVVERLSAALDGGEG